MTRSAHSSSCPTVNSLIATFRAKASLVLAMLIALASVAFAAPSPTSISLAISATSVPYQTPITLTATVTSSGSPVSAGIVLFCEATAIFCENNSALGIAQLTHPGATASVKLGSGPIGNHSYKAVYRANNLYSSSLSNTVTYAVTGTHQSTTSLASTGTPGSYNLTGTVNGLGMLSTGPTGSISFLDTSNGNNLLGTENLVVSTLATTFSQKSPFAIGGPGATQRSAAIASAYLDTDNNLDVVTGDAAQTISVLLGNGDGSFKPKVNYPGCTVGKVLQIVLADFNRDGNTDIALGCSNGATGGLLILLGNGDGSFQNPVLYSTGDVASIAMGDFNRDGLLDFAVTNNSQQNVTILLGNGDGTFTKEATTLSTHRITRGIVVADFNQDGKDDIAYALSTSVSGSSLFDLFVALGNGDGTFQQQTTPIAQQIGEFLTAGDTNGDNKTDIIAATITEPGGTLVGQSLFVLLGNGDGTFQTPVSYLSDIPSDPHLADVNGDGIPDIIAGGSTGALVYQGVGDGTFQPYQEPTIGGFALTYAVNAGDFNNDGNADLIGTDADTPRAAVALSQVAQTSTASALTNVAVFPLGSGIHNVDASYPGDSIYSGSVSTTVPLLAAPVNTSLALSTSPVLSSLAGQPVTLTATLSPYTVGPPFTTTNGDLVNFYSGVTPIGSGTLSNGVATLTTTLLTTGSDSLTAVFPGDTNYNLSNSSAVSFTVADILLTSSVNPSTYKQTVTFTATIGSGKTGNVNFFDGGTLIGSAVVNGPTVPFTTSSLSVGSHNITAQFSSSTSPVLVQVVNKATPTVTVTTSGPSTFGGTVTITATVPPDVTGTITFSNGSLPLGSGTIVNGTVSITTTVLGSGSDVITAAYSGDNNYTPASGTVTQTVGKATPTSTLTSSVNPSLPGASVTFTDTLLPNTVTGTVTFKNGSTTIGTGTVSGGIATVSTSTLPLGSDTITATYGGDTNFSSSVATMTQNVAKLTPTLNVSTSGPSIFGQTVTITASLPAGPTGTITITSGGTTLGTGTVTSSNGTVTVTTSTLPVGSDLITAVYGGDATNATATATTTQVVSKASPTETLTSSLNPSTFGQSVTLTATLPTNVTGTVTFKNGTTSLSTSPVTNGVATFATSTLPAGTDSISAIYSGDSNNSGATASLTQTVDKTTPAVTVTTSGPSNYGDPVTITVTLPAGTTGTVTVTSGTTTLGSGTVNPTTGTVTITTSSLPVGTDPITGSYSGDSNNNPAIGTTNQVVAKATPVVALTSSANPSATGQSVTFTAMLPSGATGTVTFANGATALGTSTLSAGKATVTTTTLPVGADPITATYNGDGNYNSATGTLTQNVGKNVTTITLISSVNPSNLNQSVTFTATIPTAATGTITFLDGSTTLGSGTLNNGVSTFTTSTLTGGAHTITASYAGDANYSPVVSSPLTQTVNKNAATVTLISSVNPSNVGQSVTFTATVTTGATGTVTFLDGAATLGTGTIASGVATYTTSTLTGGTHTITASYGGDTTYNSAVSAPLTQTVNKNTPVLPPPAVSTNNPTYGTPVTITETVPPGVTGPVTFSNGTNPIGTAPIVGGVATITISNLPLGTDPITASTPGDSNNNPATSAPTTVTVTKASPTVSVSSSLNPSVFNQAVTFTATTATSATGTITFTDGAIVLGTSVLTNGQAAFTTSTLSVGSHGITASYGGDTNNNAATSAPLNQVVNKATPVIPPPVATPNNPTPNTPVTITETVPPGVTGTVTFSNGNNPIGTAPIVGGTATITVPSLPVGTNPITATTSGDSNNNPATSAPTNVTVSAVNPVLVAPIVSSNNPAPNTPVTITEPIPTGVTGPVTFYNGTNPLGTAPIVNGQATLTVPSLPVGTDQITVTAINSATSGTITSPATTVTVAKATVIVTLASSVNPAAPGQAITFSATVPAGATGSITFLDGTTVLGVGTIAAGVATFTTPTLSIGSHSITASYDGDSSNSAAISAVLTEVVGKIPTVTTIVVSAPAQLLHTGVTFTANVTATSPNATGTVTFMEGTTVLGSSPLSANGGVIVSLTTNANAAYATTNLVTGNHQIVAVYSGDSTFAPSTSAPVPNTVEDFTNTNTGAASQNMFPGGSTTYKFTLTPVGATTFLDDVTVAIDGLPAGSTYTFTPSKIAAGSGSTEITVNVQTSSSLNAQNHAPQNGPSPRNELPIALGMLGIVGLGAARKLRRKLPRTLLLLVLALGSILPIAALSGCAGGYFTLTPTTYSLTVTGTESAIQHAATATLVVQ
jgi:hypothetical protein